MDVRFYLPTGYAARDMKLVLSKEPKGWRFYGYADGYAVIARNFRGNPLCDSYVFQTRHEAAIMARQLNLPAFAVWNGRTRRYYGLASAATIRAYNVLEHPDIMTDIERARVQNLCPIVEVK